MIINMAKSTETEVLSNILVIYETSEELTEFVNLVRVNRSAEQVHLKQMKDINKLELNGNSDQDEDESMYDIIYLGIKDGVNYDDELLSYVLRMLQPGGRGYFRQVYVRPATPAVFLTQLKLRGFVNMSVRDLHTRSNGAIVMEVRCKKPNFAVGSSLKLTLPPTKKTVWTLEDGSADDENVDTIDTIETIDPDTLLDEKDFTKPTTTSLRVCATTGKRKACKNCSCGLAEELLVNGDVAAVTTTTPLINAQSSSSSSACGNCYLGDAFRCASCPYLGMPAFKPGEKVQLTDAFLQPDI